MGTEEVLHDPDTSATGTSTDDQIRGTCDGWQERRLTQEEAVRLLWGARSGATSSATRTSALDNATQAAGRASLARLSVARVVIAHRLSTVPDTQAGDDNAV